MWKKKASCLREVPQLGLLRGGARRLRPPVDDGLRSFERSLFLLAQPLRAPADLGRLLELVQIRELDLGVLHLQQRRARLEAHPRDARRDLLIRAR